MLRNAGGSITRAGWHALALAVLLTAVSQTRALPMPAFVDVLIFPAMQLVGMVVVVATIRLLAAYRPVPMPPPPEVDEAGRRVGNPGTIPLVSAADRSPRVALRRAAGLASPLLRYVVLELLLLVVAVLFVLPFAGDSLDLSAGEELTDRQAFAVVLPAELVGALLTAFVVLAPQRIGLEGDPRVLVAAAHSVRVARTMFGPMFLLSLLWIAPGVAGSALLAYERPIVERILVAVVAVPVQLLVLAGLNEIYARGPRLDVPVEFGSRPG